MLALPFSFGYLFSKQLYAAFIGGRLTSKSNENAGRKGAAPLKQAVFLSAQQQITGDEFYNVMLISGLTKIPKIWQLVWGFLGGPRAGELHKSAERKAHRVADKIGTRGGGSGIEASPVKPAFEENPVQQTKVVWESRNDHSEFFTEASGMQGPILQDMGKHYHDCYRISGEYFRLYSRLVTFKTALEYRSILVKTRDYIIAASNEDREFGSGPSHIRSDCALAGHGISSDEVARARLFHARLKKIGWVVGPKGANINLAKEKTSIKTFGMNGDMRTLTGFPDAVRMVEYAVKQLLEKGYTSLQFEDYEEDGVQNPSLFLDLIHKGGVTFRRSRRSRQRRGLPSQQLLRMDQPVKEKHRLRCNGVGLAG